MFCRMAASSGRNIVVRAGERSPLSRSPRCCVAALGDYSRVDSVAYADINIKVNLCAVTKSSYHVSSSALPYVTPQGPGTSPERRCTPRPPDTYCTWRVFFIPSIMILEPWCCCRGSSNTSRRSTPPACGIPLAPRQSYSSAYCGTVRYTRRRRSVSGASGPDGLCVPTTTSFTKRSGGSFPGNQRANRYKRKRRIVVDH